MMWLLIAGLVAALVAVAACARRSRKRSAQTATSDNEFMEYGQTVAEVLSHRAEAEDWRLDANIGFLLLNKAEEKGIDAFSEAERHIYTLEGMIREVNNGGFHQYFFNSAGDLASDLIPALTAIRSTEAKVIAERALAIFGKPLFMARERRIEHLQQMTDQFASDPWEACDGLFYEITEPLETMMLDYIEQHLDAFTA